MIEKQAFLSFKERYRYFERRNKEKIVHDFKGNFNRLNASYNVIKNLSDKLNSTKAEDFNFFKILGIDHLEVKTHTPFISELLDPNGSHGQKNIFLATFLNSTLGFSDKEAQDDNWYVIKEKEHIDIRILNHSLKKAIYIENKINSDAYSGQLSRYYKHWKEGFFQGHGAFIYLTPSGNIPSNNGFDENIYPKKEILKELKLFSYHDQIHNWLVDTFPKIQSVKVQHTLSQYIDIIKRV